MHDHQDTHEHLDGHEVHVHQPDSPLQQELISHLPLSVASVALGLVLAGLICFLTPAEFELSGADIHESAHLHADGSHPAHGHEPQDGHDHQSGFLPMFHLFHPLHMLFSAAATSAMFWRYDKRIMRAVLVGFSGAVVVCGISDILVPHAALIILKKNIALHICVVEHPGLVFPFAIVGVAVGLLAAQGVMRSTFFSHSLHVFTSTMASIFYMVAAYGRVGWIADLGWIFSFVLVAVVVPCCLSDIVFPVAMSKPAREQYSKESCCH